MSLVLSTLRARCADAEARAFKAERSLKASRASHRKSKVTLGHVLDALDTARSGAAALQRTLRGLAAHQLGEGASRREVETLMGKWIGEDLRRTPPESTTLTVVVQNAGPLLGKLFGEDDHG